jgi:tRNA-2-methylthio-N6-dimethylallyladenosine synthase
VVPHYHNKFSALVPIMTGCNNFCSYCAVPYVRGRERSRKVVEVLVEIKKLAQQGYLEIILLGQNVNSYLPKDKKIFSRRNPFKHPFAALLWEINQIKGLERIFFTAPHPKDMADEVIKALALPKMVNYLHLPVQAGSDKILKRMNRHYRASDYLKLVKKIKKQKPDIALGTDIIVGFPGETKKDFAATVALYRKVEFDIAYTARYSPRAGTVAAKLSDNISVREKDRRWWVLQRLMEKIALEKNQKYRSQIVSVLVDKYKDGRCEGNSREMKRVEFQGSKELVGKVVQIKINKALTWILQGMIN